MIINESKGVNENIVVGTMTPFGESGTDHRVSTPKDAIEQWFKLNKKDPTCVCIQVSTNDEGKRILQWASDNKDQLRKWASQYKCPYKIDWLLSEVDRKLKSSKVIDWEMDQLYPFSLG